PGICLELSAEQISEISQPESVQTVEIGDSATIKCYIKSIVMRRVWYKVTTERKLQLVVTYNSHYNRIVFSEGFDRRYSVKLDQTSSNLSISTTSWEDVGTYFCGVVELNEIQFGSGTFLMLKGTKTTSDSVIQQPESQSVRSGESVTLTCSVHSDQCTAEYTRVAWLKNSDHSAPEMIYSSENKNICKKTDSGQITCVYNLQIRSQDDAGAYYCAVSSCGEILFGNGTKIINIQPSIIHPSIHPYIHLLLTKFMVTGLLVPYPGCYRAPDYCTYFNVSVNTYLESYCNFLLSQTGDAVVYSSVSSAHRSLSPRQATVKASKDAVVYSNLRHCQESTKVSSCEYEQASDNDD
uniref:Ig-like domain-containing protein n=1 Tax=Amphilophus citrinellus TaxID=61819 RepID=A0A3Q0S827_AMPCI